jgi:Flp pilus assembly protein TadG
MNTPHRREERGSVTVWTLGVVLVVMFLGAISFDLWSGFAARRAYAAAADQAARAGADALDESAYRATGRRQLDARRAEQLADDSLSRQGLHDVTSVAVDADTASVTVEITADIDVGLLRIFGGGGPLVIHVRAVGQPRQEKP